MISPVHVEDGNEREKSVLTRQIMYGVMKQGLSVNLFTTGNTTKSFVRQKEPMSPEVSEYFRLGYLKQFPHDVVGFKWNKAEIENVLRRLIE